MLITQKLKAKFNDFKEAEIFNISYTVYKKKDRSYYSPYYNIRITSLKNLNGKSKYIHYFTDELKNNIRKTLYDTLLHSIMINSPKISEYIKVGYKQYLLLKSPVNLDKLNKLFSNKKYKLNSYNEIKIISFTWEAETGIILNYQMKYFIKSYYTFRLIIKRIEKEIGSKLRYLNLDHFSVRMRFRSLNISINTEIPNQFIALNKINIVKFFKQLKVNS